MNRPPDTSSTRVDDGHPAGAQGNVSLEDLPNSPGFWREAWRRFRRRKLAMGALIFVGFLVVVAIFSPAIAGTKPVIVRYKGKIYFPALGYFNPRWRIRSSSGTISANGTRRT